MATAKRALPSASVGGQVFERLAPGLDLLVGEPELIAGKAGPLGRQAR